MSISSVDLQGRRFRYVLASLLFASLSIHASTTIKNWQGPYVGAYVGGGFANEHASTNTDVVYFSTAEDINAVNNAGTANNNPSSVIAGIQAGHDWAWKQLVYGIVLDYSATPLNSSKNVSSLYPNSSDTYSVRTSMSTNWLFTLRGRLGFQTTLHWPALAYLTSGFALTQLKVSNNFTDNSSLAGAGGNSTSENKVGWTLGAGVELASFEHASLNFEYLYVHIPSVKVTSSISNVADGFGIPAHSLTSPFTTSGQFHASLFKLALNYRFDE